MSVKIKLTKTGRKKKQSFRIVVMEERSKVTGSVIATLGSYNPTLNPPKLIIEKESLEGWLKNGAQPTVSVRHLFKKNNVLTSF